MVNHDLNLASATDSLQPFVSGCLVTMRDSYAMNIGAVLSDITKLQEDFLCDCFVLVPCPSSMLKIDSNNYTGNHNVSKTL